MNIKNNAEKSIYKLLLVLCLVCSLSLSSVSFVSSVYAGDPMILTGFEEEYQPAPDISQTVDTQVVSASTIEQTKEDSDDDKDDAEESCLCWGLFKDCIRNTCKDLKDTLLLKNINLEIIKDVGLFNDGLILNPGYAFQLSEMEASETDPTCSGETDPKKHPKYVRIDRLKFGMECPVARPSTSIPIGIRVGTENELYSFRYYQDRVSALKDTPFVMENLPVNAEKALKMKEGEMMVIPSNLSLQLSGKIPIPLSYISLNIGANVIVSGEFRIQVLRLIKDKVRVRITLERSQGASASVTLSPPKYSILSVPVVGDAIGGVVDLLDSSALGVVGDITHGLVRGVLDTSLIPDILRVGLEGKRGDFFEFDYIFDLTNEDAKKAYDKLLSPKTLVKDVGPKIFSTSTVKKGKKEETEEADLGNKECFKNDERLSDLSTIQQLVSEDASKTNKRIEQLFRSEDDYSKTSAGVSANILLASGSFSGNYGLHQLTYTPADKSDKLKLALSHAGWKGGGTLLFGLLSESWKQNNMILSHMDEKNKEQIAAPMAIGISVSRTDNLLTSRDWNNFKNHVMRNIPKSVRDDLVSEITKKFGSTDLSKMTRDVNIDFQIILNEKGLEYFSSMTFNEFNKKVDEYLSSESTLLDSVSPHLLDRELLYKVFVGKNKDQEDLTNIDDKVSGEDRIKKVSELRNSLPYQLFGMGLISSILPKEKTTDYLHMFLNIKGLKLLDGKKNFHYEFGNSNNKDLFKSMAYALRASNNQSTFKMPDGSSAPTAGIPVISE